MNRYEESTLEFFGFAIFLAGFVALLSFLMPGCSASFTGPATDNKSDVLQQCGSYLCDTRYQVCNYWSRPGERYCSASDSNFPTGKGLDAGK